MAIDVGGAPMAPRAGLGRWPLRGRTRELLLLKDAVRERRGAVIAGPAGSGKTVLALAALEFAQDLGMSVAVVAGTEAARPYAFGALASLLPPEPGRGRARITRRPAPLLHARAARRRRRTATPALRRRCAPARRWLVDADAPVVPQRLGRRAGLRPDGGPDFSSTGRSHGRAVEGPRGDAHRSGPSGRRGRRGLAPRGPRRARRCGVVPPDRRPYAGRPALPPRARDGCARKRRADR